MSIRQSIFTQNDCYKANRFIKPQGIMVHSTGANNKKLSRYLPGDELIGYNQNNNHWDMPNLNVCVHGFIGVDLKGEIQTYQTLPWDMRGWHCAGTGNSTHISFEICEDDLTDANYFWGVYSAAAQLCALLCVEYDITPENVICHSEGSSMGIASDHADVMHWFPIFGADMDMFRADVAKQIELLKKEANPMINDLGNTPSPWAAEACQWAKDNGLIKGDEYGNMYWQDNVTREELAVILKRILDK